MAHRCGAALEAALGAERRFYQQLRRERGDFEMLRSLVERGADITIADKYSDRPYTMAVQSKNQEMVATSGRWIHNEQEKVRWLKPYRLPAAMAE